MSAITNGLRKQRRFAVRESMIRRGIDYPELALMTGLATGTLANCTSGGNKSPGQRSAIERALKIAVWP